MKPSALQLVRYLVTDISCAANPNFKTDKALEGAFEQYLVDVKFNQMEQKNEFPGHPWSVELGITQTLKEGQNFPYGFKISVIGIFAFQDGALPGDKEKEFVRINGSSMLYGVAREHIRTITAAGPWGAIIIPTMSFYDNKEATPQEATESKSPKA